MANAYTEIRRGHILPGFPFPLRYPGRAIGRIREVRSRLAKALGIERRLVFCMGKIPTNAKWGEKNDAGAEVFRGPQAEPCKPLRPWAMILQENKIRK